MNAAIPSAASTVDNVELTTDKVKKSTQELIEKEKSRNTRHFRVFWLWERYEDNSRDGGWFEIEWENFIWWASMTDQYKKGFLTWKTQLGDAYLKAWWWYLERDETVLWRDVTAKQTTLWWAVWYWIDNLYNIEAWYLDFDLDWIRDLVNWHTTQVYVEWIWRVDAEKLWMFETVLSYEDLKAYDDHFNKYSVWFWYYPTDDIRVWANYGSMEHTSDDYQVYAGLSYSWWGTKNSLSPFIRWTYNTDENMNVSLEYSNNIKNKPLGLRDKFEKGMSWTDIKAKTVNPTEYISWKTVVETPDDDEIINDTPEVLISTPVINPIWTITIDDDGGLSTRAVTTISW